LLHKCYYFQHFLNLLIYSTIKIQVFFHLKTHHTNKTENEDVFIEKAIKVDL